MNNINIREDQGTEFKQSWRDEPLQWICGFANAQGGTIYIGVADDGRVVGLHDAKRLMEDIPNKVSMSMGILVDVNLHSLEGCEYISITVKPSQSPVGCKGKFYYRSGATNQELSGIALQDFLLKKNNLSWDSLPVNGSSIADIDTESVDYFVRRGIHYGRVPASTLGLPTEHILRNLNLIADDGQMTGAAILLFGRNPQKWFVGAVFRIGRFHTSETDIIFQDEIEGNLIHMPDAVLDRLKSKYLKSYIRFEGMQRIEELEVPEEAMREILCNSIVHREYRGVHTQMKVYDNSMRIWNAGVLIDGMTVESLRRLHNSCPRNKLIAKVFYLAGYIENWGRGIEKVDNGFRSAGLAVPQYEESCGGVVTIIPRRNQMEGTVSGNDSEGTQKNVAVNVAEELTERQKEILEIMSSDVAVNVAVNTKFLAEHMGVNRKTIQRDLSVLQQNSLIRWEGSAKTGHWEVISLSLYLNTTSNASIPKR